jgi:DNA-binding NarL/FixJ family response regulator
MTEQPTASAAHKTRVLLVEDHPIVRHGLCSLIDDEPDMTVCGSAESVAEALQQMKATKPDVAVVDITLGDSSGLDFIAAVSQGKPGMPILALSMHDESVYGERALRAGAKGYIMKKEAMDKLLTAIRRVMAGEMYVSDHLTTRLLSKLVNPAETPRTPGEVLSDREFEVFRMIADGLGPTEIARRLSVSVKTVQTHREHIKEKLSLKTASELNRFAMRWSMPPDSSHV